MKWFLHSLLLCTLLQICDVISRFLQISKKTLMELLISEHLAHVEHRMVDHST